MSPALNIAALKYGPWIILAALLFGGGLYIRGVQAERDEARAEALTASQAADVMALELQASHRALEARSAEINRLTVERAALNDKLREVYEHDEAAKNWADSCLPDSVECLLR